MKLRWTYHAQYRLHQRKFPINDVKAVISKPDFTDMTSDGKLISIGKVRGKTMKVIYIDRMPRYYLIVSAYYI